MTARTGRSELIVVRTTKLGETDAIVTGLTSQGSLLRGVVKGYRKPGSRLGGRLPLFARSRVDHSPGRTLDTISDAVIENGHTSLRLDPGLMAAASAIVSAAERLSSSDVPESRSFDLTDAALSALESNDRSLAIAIVATYMVKAMALSGFRPSTRTCARCGAIASDPRGFSCESGGFLCADCSSTSAADVIYCNDSLGAWVETVLQARFVELLGLAIPPAAAVDLLRFSKSWMEHFTGARLKALDFLLAGTLVEHRFFESVDDGDSSEQGEPR